MCVQISLGLKGSYPEWQIDLGEGVLRRITDGQQMVGERREGVPSCCPGDVGPCLLTRLKQQQAKIVL